MFRMVGHSVVIYDGCDLENDPLDRSREIPISMLSLCLYTAINILHQAASLLCVGTQRRAAAMNRMVFSGVRVVIKAHSERVQSGYTITAFTTVHSGLKVLFCSISHMP